MNLGMAKTTPKGEVDKALGKLLDAVAEKPSSEMAAKLLCCLVGGATVFEVEKGDIPKPEVAAKISNFYKFCGQSNGVAKKHLPKQLVERLDRASKDLVLEL